MIASARKIMQQQAGAFEPEKFGTRYENALREPDPRRKKADVVTAERGRGQCHACGGADKRASRQRQGQWEPCCHKAQGAVVESALLIYLTPILRCSMRRSP